MIALHFLATDCFLCRETKQDRWQLLMAEAEAGRFWQNRRCWLEVAVHCITICPPRFSDLAPSLQHIMVSVRRGCSPGGRSLKNSPKRCVMMLSNGGDVICHFNASLTYHTQWTPDWKLHFEIVGGKQYFFLFYFAITKINLSAFYSSLPN